VGRPLYENFFFNYAFLKLNTLRGQLADIGFSPRMIDYLALSHAHIDHSGNANMFVASTWLTSKPERDAMFAAPAGTEVSGLENFDRLKTGRTRLIPDNYDVFGDGAVVIKEAFGHSPGHQVLAIKLQELGTVILAGDLWHYPEERALKRIGAMDAKTTAPQARIAIDAWAKAHNAQIWLAHDLMLFKKLRKSPGYYE
jgi:glyoxylase-like metal-dependent hydrolase (beta-lactamase superfamily II)